jgi:hypothetical protein
MLGVLSTRGADLSKQSQFLPVVDFPLVLAGMQQVLEVMLLLVVDLP